MVKTATIFKVISNSFKLKVKPILLWLQVIIINSLEHDQNESLLTIIIIIVIINDNHYKQANINIES